MDRLTKLKMILRLNLILLNLYVVIFAIALGVKRNFLGLVAFLPPAAAALSWNSVAWYRISLSSARHDYSLGFRRWLDGLLSVVKVALGVLFKVKNPGFGDSILIVTPLLACSSGLIMLLLVVLGDGRRFTSER